MYQRVSTEEFFKVIGPLNVTLEIRGNYPYKTLFRLKQGGKLVGFEEHERYYLNVEDIRPGFRWSIWCQLARNVVVHCYGMMDAAVSMTASLQPAHCFL